MPDDSPKVDAFKFVALRPSQRAKEVDTKILLIQDKRAETEDGRQVLARIAHDVSRPSPRMIETQAKQLEVLIQLAQMRDAANDHLAASPTPFDPDAVIAAAGDPPVVEKDPDYADWAWNAVYAAYLTGPGAGARLDPPMMALRWLHTSGLAAEGKLATPKAFEYALSAVPVIDLPPAIDADTGNGEGAADTRQGATSESLDENLRSHEDLISEVVATQQLLTAARNARNETATMRSSTAQQLGDRVRRADIVIGNVPRLTLAGTDRPSESELHVLSKLGVNNATSIPAAARMLESHLGQLNRRAYVLRDDPDFATMVLKSGNAGLGVFLTLPAGVKLPSLPTVSAGAIRKAKIADVNVAGRIKPLGIGDLKVVKQTLLEYIPGEVAHIENVLKGESKERKHRVLDRTENVLFQSDETTEESERDTQTTDRFELKREAEKTIKEDMQVSAGLTVTGSFGPVSITAQGNFAYATSKEESQKNSSNFAREVVDRSVSKIQKKVKTERTTTTIHEVEEINNHGLDNTLGADHITGVYRWVDKRYRAQVYNYGVRMMIEFIVPEPAAYFRASLEAAKNATIKAKPPDPFTDQTGGPLTPSDINSTNYQIFAARYNATGITPPPSEYLYISTGLEGSGIQNGQTFSKSVRDIVIPDGYIWDHYQTNVSIVYQNLPQFSLQVGDEQHHFLDNQGASRAEVTSAGTFWGGDPADDPRGIVPVTAIGYDINAYMVHVSVCCRCTSEKEEQWQLTTYDKIYTAYKALQTEYEQKLAQAEAQNGAIIIEGRNSAMNRDIEKRELKKLCLTLLTGKHFNDNDAMIYPVPPSRDLPEVDVLEAFAEGPTMQFFEQAFDWEQITYLYYPYFWAQKSQWLATSNLTDPDPLFTHFLQAGAARVILPVPMAYKDAMIYYLQTGQIWEGGSPPLLKDTLFESIETELRNRTDDLAGAVPEGDPWEFTLPTTLVWLQQGPELPVFEP